MLIGGVILAFYIVVGNLLRWEMNIGAVEAFFFGAFFTAILVNAYRVWRRIFGIDKLTKPVEEKTGSK